MTSTAGKQRDRYMERERRMVKEKESDAQPIYVHIAGYECKYVKQNVGNSIRRNYDA